MNRDLREILLGAGVLAVFGLALAWASAGGKSASAGEGYRLVARFGQIDGLAVGSPVQLAGVQIGSVAAIDLDPQRLKPLVSLRIRRDVELPADSGVLILSDGVLGGKFIRIEPGSEPRAMKSGDAFMTVQDSVILEQILEKIVQGAEARRRSGK